jgi:hypothetical protein
LLNDHSVTYDVEGDGLLPQRRRRFNPNGWVLDFATGLVIPAPPNTWQPVPAAYQTNATEISVCIPVTPRNRFYRLRRP